MVDNEDGYHRIELNDEDFQLVGGVRRPRAGAAALIGVSFLVLLSTVAVWASGAVAAPDSTSERESSSAVILDEEADARARKAKAQEEKQAGSEAYKKRDFGEAVQRWEAAIALDDTDISFHLNLAAVDFEQENWDACIKRCDEAVEKGRNLFADYKLIAKAMTRKGRALAKKGELVEAVDLLKKSLLEHRNPETSKLVTELERQLREKLEDEYINLTKCEEAKEKGNAFFKEGKYPESVEQYTEAIKRGPAKANPEAYKLFSNRAGSYTKLLAVQEALKDAEMCVELKPDFPKGYSRKGTAQFFMRDYTKAMETYRKGLEIAPDNEELKAGMRQCRAKIQQGNSGAMSKEEQKERHERAMADPEIQAILTDPVMRQVLNDLSEDADGAQKHLKNPTIMAKINKLVEAGIVQMSDRPKPRA